jgi:hypothetical protein
MKKPKVKFGATVQVEDGKAYKWYPRKDGTYVEATVCCDCNLTHVVELKPNRGYLRVKVWREEEETNALRSSRKAKRS